MPQTYAECGAGVREWTRFCAACGASLVSPCPECGTGFELDDGVPISLIRARLP